MTPSVPFARKADNRYEEAEVAVGSPFVYDGNSIDGLRGNCGRDKYITRNGKCHIRGVYNAANGNSRFGINYQTGGYSYNSADSYTHAYAGAGRNGGCCAIG
uniref:Uncharacterized protein n=1 Tax=Eubacterium cellulosolvens (strain ATCC 43171 / JCM 9499 / 6) TaxID=633697 RepID=I5AXE0_EUBC6